MNINFWLERPPFAITGILKGLKDKGANINLFIKSGQRSSRNDIDNSIDDIFSTVYYETFEELNNEINIIKNGINIINGFGSLAFPFLNSIRKKERIVIGCMTEQLNPLGKFKAIKSQLLKIKYRQIVSKLQKDIDFLLPIGDEALLYFEKLGWKKPCHSIFYIPDLNYSPAILDKDLDGELFCYIGRNDYVDKGLDLAINYFKRHKENKLLIVGNYGNNSLDVSNIIKKYNNINRIEPISPNKLIGFCTNNRIKCILVPSKSDGWNPNVYISLLSSIPCLCSTKTGNSSLVNDNHTGIVFRPTNKAFSEAMREFELLSKEDINKMRDNAKKFALLNSPDKQCENLLVFLARHNSNY